MRLHKIILTFTACALILVVAGIVPLNYIHKHVQVCASGHKKAVVSQCLRDSATSSVPTDAVSLIVSAPADPQEIATDNVEVVDFCRFVVNASTGAPPLRC